MLLLTGLFIELFRMPRAMIRFEKIAKNSIRASLS